MKDNRHGTSFVNHIPYVELMGIGIVTSLTSVLWVAVFETKAEAMLPVFAQLAFGVCICLFCLLTDRDLKDTDEQKVKNQ